MAEKNLLILERSSQNLQKITRNGKTMLEGVFAEFGIENRNGRIYEEKEYLPHMEYLKKDIANGNTPSAASLQPLFYHALKAAPIAPQNIPCSVWEEQWLSKCAPAVHTFPEPSRRRVLPSKPLRSCQSPPLRREYTVQSQ